MKAMEPMISFVACDMANAVRLATHAGQLKSTDD